MKRQIVTLCGSTKFKEEFLRKQQELVLNGDIVLTVSVFYLADNIELSKKTFEELEALHRDQIAMSTKIVVINKDDYISETTAEEIKYAESLGLEVEYMYPRI